MHQRLRISFQSQEIELQGESEFIERWAPELKRWMAEHTPAAARSEPPAAARSEHASQSPDVPARSGSSIERNENSLFPDAIVQTHAIEPETLSFGEYMTLFPRHTTDVDRMLIAGFFRQKNSADNGFTTSEANSLLQEQSVKVGNASQSVKQNVTARRAFRLAQGRYRVSVEGIDYLKKLGGDHAIYRD